MNLYLNSLSFPRDPLALQDYTLLGADENSTLPLFDASVAPRHARIEKKDKTFILRDLNSSFGTYLNETKVKEAEIQVGDVVKVGPFEFQVCTDEQEKKCQLTSRNPILQREFDLINNMAKTEFSVLLLGPSGAGKDVVAREIHRCSGRHGGPFVSVNCSTLNENLIESELFGHLKGSFTGAIQDRKGAFEAARGGTLFLDEIGDMPIGLQAKLLRALENNEIRPVGSDHTIKTNVRIIAATHQNLFDKIQMGQFRMDLYFRLNVVQMNIPSLLNRMEDFEELLMHFARSMRVRFSMPAIYRMKKHSWPGNIRELRNVVARAKAFFPQEYIQEEHMDLLLDPGAAQAGREPLPDSQQNLPVLKEIERQMILKRLSANKGNQRRTALDLGIPKSTLHDRLKYYNIDVKQYRF
jgi:DNA-binding NtrC family response regulator